MTNQRPDLAITRFPFVGVQPDQQSAVPFDEVIGWVKSHQWRHILAYRDVCLTTPSTRSPTKPFLTAIILRALARRRCEIHDDETSVEVGAAHLARVTAHYVRDLIRLGGYTRTLRQRHHALLDAGGELPSRFLDRDRHPLYVTGGIPAGLASGGEISHTAGVLNSLVCLGPSPVWVTTETFQAVTESVRRVKVESAATFADFGELAQFALGDRVADALRQEIASDRPSFLYQRSNLGLTSAQEVGLETGVPVVLEFNSSVGTYTRLWGGRIDRRELVLQAERASLLASSLVVVVSDQLRAEVVRYGVHPDRILVNPNGVDPDAYSPSIDGSPVRREFGIADRTVIGFVGTFRPYHGATVLAEAFVQLMARAPQQRDRVALMLVGDGPELQAVRRILDEGQVLSQCVFTGRTSQDAGREFMAACDILTSPHVPNTDGTPFFGSPTKLFEYMAMGKAIVASDLEQLGEVLDNDDTAWLVRPGDPDALSKALQGLIDSAEVRARLGAAARATAEREHTWEQHTQRIVHRLAELHEGS